jgi:hypothetical protein
VRIRLALIVTVAAALIIPVTATSTPTFPVSTSFAGCEDPPTSCRIAVGFAPVSGAAGYEGTAHLPDGSSHALGSLAPGTTTVAVPYRGNGTYVVTVTALRRGVVAAEGSQGSQGSR